MKQRWQYVLAAIILLWAIVVSVCLAVVWLRDRREKPRPVATYPAQCPVFDEAECFVHADSTVQCSIGTIQPTKEK